MEQATEPANRRPLRARGTAWARFATRLLLRSRISADAISLIGILFSIIGALAYVGSVERPWLLLAGAVCVQLRLLCNLFDGLVAVEGGRKSPYGALFNEAPDRIEDSATPRFDPVALTTMSASRCSPDSSSTPFSVNVAIRPVTIDVVPLRRVRNRSPSGTRHSRWSHGS